MSDSVVEKRMTAVAVGFGKRMRARRERLVMSQGELARDLRISRQAVGQIEEGAKITIGRAVLIAEALGVKVGQLVRAV